MSEPNIYDAGQDHTKHPDEYSKPDAGTPTPRTGAAISNGWIKEGSSAAAKFTEMERELTALRAAHEAAQAEIAALREILHDIAECHACESGWVSDALIQRATAAWYATKEKS